MSASISRLLVIDASVARAAGGKDATSPISVCCRNFLQTVLDIGYRFVMTPDIKEEWNKHQSYFAKRWRSSMVAKKKLEYYSDIQVNRDLWDVMDRLAETDKQRQEMFKDIRLIEAALATDKTIISLDDKTARRFFAKAAAEFDELKTIVWVNPGKIEENSIEWLQNGAEPERERSLGFQAEES
jgi:hypothetical protein